MKHCIAEQNDAHGDENEDRGRRVKHANRHASADIETDGGMAEEVPAARCPSQTQSTNAVHITKSKQE